MNLSWGRAVLLTGLPQCLVFPLLFQELLVAKNARSPRQQKPNRNRPQVSDSETTGRTCSCFWLFSLRQIRDFSKKHVAYRRKFGVCRTVQLLEASGQPASFQNIHTPKANWARYTFLNWVINFIWDFAKFATVKVSDGLKKTTSKANT